MRLKLTLDMIEQAARLFYGGIGTSLSLFIMECMTLIGVRTLPFEGTESLVTQ